MGWKNVKEHYRIGHHVAFHEGDGLCIGSGYVYNLIMIDPKARTIKHSSLSLSGNAELRRYWAEINADPDKLWDLISSFDHFEKSIPVFTYEGGAILLAYCEELGWPNVTHDGRMMYENMFFGRREDAIAAAKRNAAAGLENAKERLLEVERDLSKVCCRIAEYEGHLAALAKADGESS